MTANELRANLETELAWRQEELAFFKNQLSNITDSEKERYRKSLVLILYSHFEGYVKISIQTYIQHLNSLLLKRREVNTNLLVTGMHKEFQAYDNLDRKCECFKRELPEDSKLHRFFRRVDLMEKIEEFKLEILSIDDQIIDIGSNLWYIVLQKNLYKIGLPVDLFKEYKSDIDGLVNRRNSIAHGNFRSGVTEQEYEKWESKTNIIMEDITRCLYDYAKNKKYLSSY
ncbi:MAE_28990/MAE_18760 family HEPN-like nuclease [Candidatus Soleaferrea massiliensis]|uniref:MAE_28990/MAE_18760 family HEPN-like nuclease n=1 Tax=Candidatus Soleaferrea massiliensis TaxID=1470354 RepID=UPI0005908ECE|nr:MAE_28990/MAE_18760 family HEPN-like nuclease [Candidatus Soleaferrea massiliensis]